MCDPSRLKIGVHVSISGAIDLSVDRAVDAGCNTFQIFTRNPRGWKFSEISEEVRRSFLRKVKSSQICPVVDHMPYLPNLASPSEEIFKKSLFTLKAELYRCDQLEIPYLVTHLGSHMSSGEDNGRRRVVQALNSALEQGNRCMILLENTAGQKNSLGTRFEDICDLIDRTDYPDRVGVCLDTCHAFAAGYDVRSEIGAVLDELDSSIGIARLMVIHMNDSVGDLGSHLDRHEHIGLGKIGEDGFRHMLSDRRVTERPLIMETPVDERRDDKGNIKKLRELAGVA
ncbi:MAG: deoxyribonuclease IV [Candidatus Verstraetearchaeota archaeon]|nr:deoxyribonuclease IV [Candidatus Verstraetearchaeota archaeon]